ncbi:LysR family transcriptional regulator [Rhodoferax sp. GW822-FHT02A01]|uniref:LysR family transcriptional regulator n=1 Tax=Rhodoferax sp. GW822-FHT02A01 TaxID=3141537 RepID=UPI00315D6EC8
MKEQNIESLWSHIYWLATLAGQGSYTAAAERLNVSKAAMSQRIAELERIAGVSLVQRTTRSVRLTEAGQRLVDETQSSFEHIAQSFDQVKDMAETPRGLVRITAPVAFARQQLVPQLPAFFKDFPEVRIELDMSDRLRSLGKEGFDLAVRHAASPPETHVAWPLCKTETLLVATPGYLRRAGEVKEPADLRNHNCLHYPRANESAAWTFEARNSRATDALVTVQVSGCLAANNSESLRDAALSGLGIALLPDFTAQSHIRSGKLVGVLPKWRSVRAFAEHLYLIRPYSPHVPRTVAVLVKHLRQRFAGGFSRMSSST